MALPDYGAAPLAKTFLIIRGLQLACFAGIIGITANFIQQFVSTNHIIPSQILATAIIASLACLYCLISIPFFLSKANIGLLVFCGLDFLFLIAFAVVSTILGKSLVTLDCPLIVSDPNNLLGITDAYDFTQTLSNGANAYSSFASWSGATKAHCLESKSTWGLCVALCILFLSSVFILPALLAKSKRAAKVASKGQA